MRHENNIANASTMNTANTIDRYLSTT